MKKIFYITVVFVFIGCSSAEKRDSRPSEFHEKYPAVTIETSGDLYYEEGGNNVQMDLFGNCAPGQKVIYVEIDNKKAATNCKNGRYRYSMNLPESFFKKGQGRSPSSKFAMKEITAYHGGHDKLSATSYVLIDRKRKEVRSVINKQVKFEKIPTGDYEPITQFNAFGSCPAGSVIQIEVTSPDRYGHEVSKYDEKKSCQKSGGFYFLSQVHGYTKKGTQFKIHVDQPIAVQGRAPASAGKVKYKNVFNWNLPVK